MSGTYQITLPDSTTLELFPKNPIVKRYTPARLATKGNRVPLFSAFWQVDFNFGTLETESESSFFETRLIQGGLYNAVLPHPVTGNLTNFTGVTIENYVYELGDIDADYWALNANLTLGINLAATGTV